MDQEPYYSELLQRSQRIIDDFEPEKGQASGPAEIPPYLVEDRRILYPCCSLDSPLHWQALAGVVVQTQAGVEVVDIDEDWIEMAKRRAGLKVEPKVLLLSGLEITPKVVPKFDEEAA